MSVFEGCLFAYVAVAGVVWGSLEGWKLGIVGIPASLLWPIALIGLVVMKVRGASDDGNGEDT